jgi:ribosomal protein S12 methylthiotransferase
MKPRTVHFVSLGCPKNMVDTEVMAGVAVDKDLVIVADPADADIIVVNTCAFIESAKRESVETLLEMAEFREKGRMKLLVSAGCLAQRYSKALDLEMPELDFLIGTEHPEHIGRVIDGTAKRVDVGPAGHFLQKKDTPRWLEPNKASAYLKIADGCSRRCSFCAIPSIRGPQRSRPISDVAAEAERLAAAGVKELNLVAQDTSAYGRDLGGGTNIAGLVSALDTIDGIAWIRLLYLYPDPGLERLVAAVRDSRKVVPYFDMPIQHASPAMLKRMRRGHGAKRLKELVQGIRRAIPEAFLRTTVLVGHPNETEEDFADLLEFLELAGFNHLGAFRYSDEEGTFSHTVGQKVPAKISYDRMRKAMSLGRRISRDLNRALKGEFLDVLIEGYADDDGYVLVGRHKGQAPEIDGVTYVTSCDARPGEIAKARVVKTGDFDLVAEPA